MTGGDRGTDAGLDVGSPKPNLLRDAHHSSNNATSARFVLSQRQLRFLLMPPAKSIYSVNAGVSLHDRYCAFFVPGSVLVERLTNTSSNAFSSVTSLLSEGTTLPKYLPENVRGVSPN